MLLFVVGSRAERSAQQVAALVQTGRAIVSRAPNGQVELEAIASTDAPVAVLVAVPDADGREGQADEVARRLAEGVGQLLRRRRVSAVIATGGDTAIAVLQRLSQPTLRVIGSLLPGIPFSCVECGGRSVWFVTKAGGFGAPDTFVTIARRFGSTL